MQKILKSFLLFLILSEAACAHAPPAATTFDTKWQVIESADGVPMACFPETDIERLREVLIRCEGAK